MIITYLIRRKEMKGLKFVLAALIITLGTTAFSNLDVYAADLKEELNTVIGELETVSKAEEDSTIQIETKTNELTNINDAIAVYDVQMVEFINTKDTVAEKVKVLEAKQLAPLHTIFLTLTNGYENLTEEDIQLAINSDLTAFDRIKGSYIKETDKAAIMKGLNDKLNIVNAQIQEYGLMKVTATETATRLNTEITALNATVQDLAGQVQQLSGKRTEIEQEVKKQNSFIKPTSGRITSGFGYRIHPVTGASSFHSGIDIADSTGTKILASRSGTVTFASYNGNYGNMIIINHGNGIETAYAHLSAINVSVGQGVSQGQVIGKMGATGRVTGPHLHFEIRINGTAVNPRNYIG